MFRQLGELLKQYYHLNELNYKFYYFYQLNCLLANVSYWPQAPIHHLKVPIYKQSVKISEVKLP